MRVRSYTDQLIGWFIPEQLLADREMRTRARMFMFSHLFGPFLGSVIPGYLLFADPSSSGKLLVLGASISSFWLFPFFLRWNTRYEILCYASIQNLLFAVLWGSYYYGGISSPFLPWLVTVPLLAFFYIGATRKSVTVILTQITLNGLAFVIVFRLGGAQESRVPMQSLQVIGVISDLSAAIYVAMMAIFYTRILNSQTEFEAEVNQHLATAAALRAAAAEADRAGAAKSEFLAKMSHELRTPLNAIIGYSQMLLEDVDPDEQQVVLDLDRIHTAGAHLLLIVNSVLDLSKIEAGKMSVETDSVAVNRMITNLVNVRKENARLSNTRLELFLDPTVGIIFTDEAKLARIVGALLSNAVAFTKNGSVTVTTKTISTDGNRSVQIEVVDTGAGIEADLLPTLFDDFMRRDDLNANRFTGAGLGLPLAHRLCQLIQANLTITSQLGTGTSAVVLVPDAAMPEEIDGPAAGSRLVSIHDLQAA